MKNKLITLIAASCGIALLSVAGLAQGPCKEPGAVRSVTKARSGNFETVTFEIVGNSLPDVVSVENTTPPIENYGGDNLRMRGPYFKLVNLRMVPWMCTIRENVRARTTTITGVKQTEQFEGHVEYAIGYTKRSKYVGKSTIIGRKTSKVIIKFRR